MMTNATGNTSSKTNDCQNRTVLKNRLTNMALNCCIQRTNPLLRTKWKEQDNYTTK